MLITILLWMDEIPAQYTRISNCPHNIYSKHCILNKKKKMINFKFI